MDYSETLDEPIGVSLPTNVHSRSSEDETGFLNTDPQDTEGLDVKAVLRADVKAEGATNLRRPFVDVSPLKPLMEPAQPAGSRVIQKRVSLSAQSKNFYEGFDSQDGTDPQGTRAPHPARRH